MTRNYWDETVAHTSECHDTEYDAVTGTWRRIHVDHCEAGFLADVRRVAVHHTRNETNATA